jgi:hypothetical protein
MLYRWQANLGTLADAFDFQHAPVDLAAEVPNEGHCGETF